MNRKGLHIFFVILYLTVWGGTAYSQLAVGKWRDHFSYNRLKQVCVTKDRVYAAAEEGLFYYDLDDYTTNRLNKTTGLNDAGIAAFNYDAETGWMVIAYNNANIDLLKDDQVYNISDIKRSNLWGAKNINSIAFHNRHAYLACSFGIAVIDLSRQEIKETYYLGIDGTYSNINDITFTDSLIVAATDNGIMTADINCPFLNIVSNWHTDVSTLIAGMPVKKLATAPNGQIMALTDDSTVYYEASKFFIVPWLFGDIRSMHVTHNKIIICYNDHIEVYNDHRQPLMTIGDIDWISMNPNDADFDDQERLWIAHDWASLVLFNPATPTTIATYGPSGPLNDHCYNLVSWDNDMMVCPGGHTTTYANSYISPNIFTYRNNDWRSLKNPDGVLANAYDIVNITVNPRNPKQRMAAAWGYGIVEINDNKVVTLYNETNTDGALSPYTVGNYSTLPIGGVAFDTKGNCWATCAWKPNALSVRYSNGSWKSFNTIEMTSGTAIDHIICDSINNYKLFWGVPNKLFVHSGDSLMAYIDPNNGAKLESSSLSCVVQDRNGNFWLGTNKGIKVIYDIQKIFNNGGHGEKSPVICSNILYNENGITEYLMAYESVTCIAVDGANRKWIGTSTGGLYLISANGLEQIEHFTTSNSPLLSDKILSLAIMPWSGELFIATTHGLQSFRATATYASAQPQDDIHAFPNPVRPDYEGVIAIKGFTRNAIVHITDAAGHTVFSTHANGGQAIWNGKTNSGKRVASGVYYVFASAEDGSSRSVAKILFLK